jgi:hypothetical protein
MRETNASSNHLIAPFETRWRALKEANAQFAR